MTATVFPAAPPAEPDGHPSLCGCGPCTEVLLVALRRPLVEPAPRMDPALDRRRRS